MRAFATSICKKPTKKNRRAAYDIEPPPRTCSSIRAEQRSRLTPLPHQITSDPVRGSQQHNAAARGGPLHQGTLSIVNSCFDWEEEACPCPAPLVQQFLVVGVSIKDARQPHRRTRPPVPDWRITQPQHPRSHLRCISGGGVRRTGGDRLPFALERSPERRPAAVCVPQCRSVCNSYSQHGPPQPIVQRVPEFSRGR